MYKTSNITLFAECIGKIWMPSIVCTRSVTVKLDRDEHKAFREHYDGDITENVERLTYLGDFQYVRFTALYLKVERIKYGRSDSYTLRARYIDLAGRFPKLMAEDELMAQYDAQIHDYE